MLTEKQCPPTYPYGLPSSGLKSRGPTCHALKRAGIRMGKFEGTLATIDDRYSAKLEAFLDEIDPGGQNGYGKGRWTIMRSLRVPLELPHAGEYALDGYALQLIQDEYRDSLPPKPPPYVEPLQGFDSLVSDLWSLYTAGRNMGLSDLGTYNGRSKLPSSGRPSDHATSRLSGRVGKPACAFDLGFSPQTGYSNPKARAFYDLVAGRQEVNYVICGDRIWSQDLGHHRYYYGGHEGHVHTSGHRR